MLKIFRLHYRSSNSCFLINLNELIMDTAEGINAHSLQLF